MKNILNEISNPYSIDNFKKILELYTMSGYMTSEGRALFYKQVVSYHRDRNINENTSYETVTSNFSEEGKYAKAPILSESMDNSHWLETSYFSNPRRCKT